MRWILLAWFWFGAIFMFWIAGYDTDPDDELVFLIELAGLLYLIMFIALITE